MISYVGDGHPLEAWLSQRNRVRQFDFMHSAFFLWEAQGRKHPTPQFLQDLNFYATHYLSNSPGELRSETKIDVSINGSSHQPPRWWEVGRDLERFFVRLAELTGANEAIKAAAFSLWRINWIHPFEQGNGRTARAFCYFLLCQSSEMWLPGAPVLPELIRNDRQQYCRLLQLADEKATDDGWSGGLTELEIFLEKLLKVQLETAIALRSE